MSEHCSGLAVCRLLALTRLVRVSSTNKTDKSANIFSTSIFSTNTGHTPPTHVLSDMHAILALNYLNVFVWGGGNYQRS